MFSYFQFYYALSNYWGNYFMVITLQIDLAQLGCQHQDQQCYQKDGQRQAPDHSPGCQAGLNRSLCFDIIIEAAFVVVDKFQAEDQQAHKEQESPDQC